MYITACFIFGNENIFVQKRKLINSHIFLLLFFLYIFYIINSCAVKGMPGGGPVTTTEGLEGALPVGGPVDKTPPEVIKTFPTPDSTNVKQLSVISFEFSESMNEGSIANTIFISPPLKFDAEWQSDDELNVKLLDSLKKNQTYVIVL